MSEPKILFEDQHLIVISKPAGMLSQGEETGADNVVDWLRRRWGRPYVGLVHRLDRNTSGLMVIAKRTKSAERLSRALQSGTLKRVYQGILCGTLNAPARWSHKLSKNTDENKAFEDPHGKLCVLDVTPLNNGESSGQLITLAEFRLETGRAHQIRAQAALMNLPLLGDTKYGGRSLDCNRPALHSCYLEFPHPLTKEILKFTDPLPADLASFFR